MTLPFRTYPFPPKPSLHVHDFCLLGWWVGGSIKARTVHCHHLSVPCCVQFQSYVFLGKLEDKGRSQGRAKRLKKGRKVDVIKKCAIFMCENCSETH